jgi:ketosteroid isomerase-like protein
MMSRIIFIALILCASLSCTSSINVEEEKTAISKAANAFSQAYVNGDLEAQMKFYTNDVAILPGSRNMIEGIEEVTKFWDIPATTNILSHKSISTKLDISGNMASDYGYYEGESVRNNDTTSFRGQYVIIWEKGEDDKWRMAVDMWSSLRNNN